MNQLQQMSESEKEIMTMIWDNGGALFISELMAQADAKNKVWKRATIRTFIARLIDKGFIITKKHGKSCEYIAALSQQQYLDRQTNLFVNDVFNGNIKGLLTSLFGQDTLEQKEMEELEQFWREGREKIK